MSFADTAPFVLYLDEQPLHCTALQHIEYSERTAGVPDQRSNVELVINNQNHWTLPCKAFLEIEGRLTKADGVTSYNAADEATMANTLMGLFTSIRLAANGTEIEALDQHVDVAATIHELARPPRGGSLMSASSRWWYPDTADSTSSVRYTATSAITMAIEEAPMVVTTTVVGNPAFNEGFAARKARTSASGGYFNARIPLSSLFGFCRDVEKMMYGIRWQLSLQRAASDGNAIVRAAETDEGKATLLKLSLWMPRLILTPAAAARAHEWVCSGRGMTVFWQKGQMRAVARFTTAAPVWKIATLRGDERSRHVFVAFQCSRRQNVQTENSLIFDALGVNRVRLVYGGRAYSQSPKWVGRAQKWSAQTDNKTGPVYYFDLRYQEEGSACGARELEFQAILRAPVPTGYKIYAFIMTDCCMVLPMNGMPPQAAPPLRGMGPRIE